ncbi:amidohydrolase [Spirochaetia bacterium]|nr:amidohydrolase [Spirochaetia bacterium]
MSIKASLIIKNANIKTMDKRTPVAQALAVQGDRIIGTGKNEDFESVLGPDTEVLDLTGKTVLPGLNDNHGHPLYAAASLAKVNVTGTKSHTEFFAPLRERAAKMAPGEWVEGYGYDDGLFAEKREPTLEELDAAVPNHPLYITRACQHVGLANSLAMKALGYGLNTPDPVGGEIVRKDGKLTGRLCESASFAMKNFIPALSVDALAKCMKDMCDIYNSFGITSTADMGMLGERQDEFSVWDKILKNGWLSVRIAGYYLETMYRKLMNEGIPLPFGNDLFRFQGRKILLDGGIGARTARMSEPYPADGKYGILYYTQEQLDEIVWEAHSHDQQVSAHGIGDVAITMILDAYKKAQTRYPRPNARHRLEHASFCFPHLVQRVIKEGVLPLIHTGFMYYFGETHIQNTGEERVSKSFPFRSLLDAGVVVATGSDTPVTVLNPFPILYSALTRKSARGLFVGGDKERITAAEGIYAYTAAGAYFTFDEDRKGTLSPGKLADIAVMDIDPTALDNEPERMLEVKVERTILGGKTVFLR